MKVFRDLMAVGALPTPVVGIGNFDGIHLGHQRILETALDRARAVQGTAVAMTFDPHPLSILRPAGRPPLITPLEEKIRILGEIGLDVLLIVPFTREFSAIRAEEFVASVLGRQVGAKRVLVGANFHFGAGGQGDFELLRREGKKAGMEVEKVDVVFLDSRPVSSTRIRENILRGGVERATEMLGREYAITGRGVPGSHRGKGLGFSTANITTDFELIPADGVYVTRAEVGPAALPSVTNIGVRPTFGEHERVIETHILDYTGGVLYGETIRLAFCRRLRDERKFASPEELKDQIGQDVDATRKWFAKH